jgi:2,3-bisphosphoglycerate-independent phosphoglycerate mutase
MVAGLTRFPEVRLAIETDHPTPISKRTHVADPVPFLLVNSLNGPGTRAMAAATFCESAARAAHWHLNSGVELFEYFVKGYDGC